MKLSKMTLMLALPLLVLSCRDRDFVYVDRTAPALRHQTQNLRVGGTGLLDVIWIIDNSGSMLSYIPDLIENADLFMQTFISNTTLDWKMGVISTSMDQAPTLGFGAGNEFTSRTPNPVQTFRDGVSLLGLNGDQSERVFESLLNALSTNSGFVRKDAALALMIVTDAPEQSAITTAAFMQQLRALVGPRRKIIAYGALAPKDFNCESTDDPWVYAGSKFQELIASTNGSTISLCGGEFGEDMSRIGRTVTATEVQKIRLATRPIPSTIKVTYRGLPIEGGRTRGEGYWYFDFSINSVVFFDTGFASDDQFDVDVDYAEEMRPLAS